MGDQPVNYGSLEYKIDISLFDDEGYFEGDVPRSSVQSFPVSPVQTIDDEDESVGGCSVVKPTCEGAPTDDVAVGAVTLYVDENWGHSDYTCIYRIELNGK